MAEIVQMSGKKTRGRPRKKKLEGYGADLLRMAAERRVAGSSEDLADLLLQKAMEGKLESVKMLMKFAEEEKARKEEVRRESEPGLFEMLGYRDRGAGDWRCVGGKRLEESGDGRVCERDLGGEEV